MDIPSVVDHFIYSFQCSIDPVNRSSLEAIENCIFVLCLDKALPISFNHQTSMDETMNSRRDDVSLALQMIHGHGSQYNSCNRWFEKTMQVSKFNAFEYSFETWFNARFVAIRNGRCSHFVFKLFLQLQPCMLKVSFTTVHLLDQFNYTLVERIPLLCNALS